MKYNKKWKMENGKWKMGKLKNAAVFRFPFLLRFRVRLVVDFNQFFHRNVRVNLRRRKAGVS